MLKPGDHAQFVLYQSFFAPQLLLALCFGFCSATFLFQQQPHGRRASIFVLTRPNRPNERAEKANRDDDAQWNEEKDDAHTVYSAERTDFDAPAPRLTGQLKQRKPGCD